MFVALDVPDLPVTVDGMPLPDPSSIVLPAPKLLLVLTAEVIVPGLLEPVAEVGPPVPPRPLPGVVGPALLLLLSI